MPLEVSLMKKTSHIDGVVKIFDILEKTDSFVIVMERPARSRDLFDYITKKVFLREDQARDFFGQIVTAVSRCQDAGVLHNDLKDENILVDIETDTLKIIDFGSGTYLKDEEYTSFDG